MRRERITWEEVDRLVDHLIPQFSLEFDAILMLRNGGIIPGGMLAEALGIRDLYLADILFPKEFEVAQQRADPRFLAWPTIRVFPESSLLRGQKILIISCAWGTGRCMSTLRNRVSGADGTPYTCVLHYNQQKNLFQEEKPDFFAAVTDAWIVYPWEVEKGKDLVVNSLV